MEGRLRTRGEVYLYLGASILLLSGGSHLCSAVSMGVSILVRFDLGFWLVGWGYWLVNRVVGGVSFYSYIIRLV